MRILFDNGTPRGLARFLSGHSVEEARARSWEELTNGELIEVAEHAGFDLIVTTEKNIRYQQNLKARKSPWWCLSIRNGRWSSWLSKTSLQSSTPPSLAAT